MNQSTNAFQFNGFFFFVPFFEQSFFADQSNCHQTEQWHRSLKSWRSVVFINFHTWPDGHRDADGGGVAEPTEYMNSEISFPVHRTEQMEKCD